MSRYRAYEPEPDYETHVPIEPEPEPFVPEPDYGTVSKSSLRDKTRPRLSGGKAQTGSSQGAKSAENLYYEITPYQANANRQQQMYGAPAVTERRLVEPQRQMNAADIELRYGSSEPRYKSSTWPEQHGRYGSAGEHSRYGSARRRGDYTSSSPQEQGSQEFRRDYVREQRPTHLTPPRSQYAESEYEYRLERAVRTSEPRRSPKENLKDYIKAIGGVPIFPPEMLGDSPQAASKIDPAENLAFRRHVLNHRQYDTLHSYRSCENCPICKSMSEMNIEPSSQPHHHKKKTESPIISGKAYEKLEEDALETLEELDQYVSSASAFVPSPGSEGREEEEPEEDLKAVVIRDFNGKTDVELSAKEGEVLQVLQRKSIFWKCRNSRGKTGWIPVQDIYILVDDQ